MQKFLASTAVAVLALLVPACGNEGGGGVSGTWVIDTAGMKERLRPKLVEQFEKQRAGLKNLPADQRERAEKRMPSLDKLIDAAFEPLGRMSAEMTLEAGGAATFSGDLGGPAKESGRGTWKQVGDRVEFTQTEKNGKPVAEESRHNIPPMTFKDGRLSTEGAGFTLLFKRK